MKINIKNKNEKVLFSFALAGLFIVFTLLSLTFINAETGVCCEKTISGAFCINAPKEQCDSNFKISPTSCDSTSYCKPGCCFDSQEGLCMESTPQNVCNAGNGTWASDSSCQIPQCNLGCCVIGDQGAFVTLTRCKQLSGFYGLKTDFRKNIKDEVSCISLAQGDDKGACVREDPATLSKTCTFTTRSSCSVGNIIGNSLNETNNSKVAEVGFYKDILCSSEELGSICGPSTKTTIVDGKDEVYFIDSCGNTANIYDASRYSDKQYWSKVYKKSESCGYANSNANSKSCGNCDYYLGSIGRKATGMLGLGQPTYGNYICIDLSCKKENKKHGESWCVTDSPTGAGKDTVGSRYYKEVCLYGEVITEPCADYRNEICIEGNFNGFTEAACRVNRWQDCIQQEEQADCENADLRDCMWMSGYYFSGNTGQVEKSTEDMNADGTKDDPSPSGLCVPNYPAGSNFWGSSSSSTSVKSSGNFSASTPSFSSTTSSLGTGYVDPSSTNSISSCSLGNSKLTVKWKKVDKLWPYKATNWECVENCQYVTSTSVDKDSDPTTTLEGTSWASEMNNICYRLGDCGGYINWQGKYTEEGFAAYKNNKRIAGSGGAEVLEAEKKTAAGTSGTTTTGTGKMIKDFIKNMVGEN